MQNTLALLFKDESETLACAAKLAHVCPAVCLIFLQGELGAGKTTFVRGFLRALGYTEKVKSPTYTLVESYVIANHNVFHFDLYRIQHKTELDDIGIKDYLATPGILLIEWPEKGDDYLPPADLNLRFTLIDIDQRKLQMDALTIKGQHLLQAFAAN